MIVENIFFIISIIVLCILFFIMFMKKENDKESKMKSLIIIFNLLSDNEQRNASLYNTTHYLLIKFRLTQILYTTFKQRYISFINLLLFIKTKLKCNKIKVLTLTKKIQTMSKDFYKTYIFP